MFQLSGFSNLKDRHITFNLTNDNLILRNKTSRILNQNVHSKNQDSVKNEGKIPNLCVTLTHTGSLKIFSYIDKSKFSNLFSYVCLLKYFGYNKYIDIKFYQH